MEVIKITKKQSDEFVTKKHYSRRASIFWAGFGLVENGFIVGVAVFGQPSPPIQKHAFKDRDFRLFELSRVVVQTKTKNAASFLIGRSLKALEPSPCAVISYADTAHGHSGIIYQATNWIYTGPTKSHDCLYIVDGEKLHPMTIRDRFGVTNHKQWAKENDIQTASPELKHRYFYLIGSQKQKKSMLSKLNYKVISEYPKSDKTMYDDGDLIHMPTNEQSDLFA